ncbi:proteinase inhibitor I4 serpin [Thiorhodococcus mannitoliphagus]|uniref:Proteinase inhibitor I4 serpin n=2 Tax=Thiorhodococcus mannitoliphagus TaxID=329406 RepID=A0A6P1E4B8_9GAMM|nr:BPTI/Kunitz domain-containing protein [Thiorhodococcus mannitoliphagus]NEX22515.1 proteinase inhibitor I4 serpin [Thiorhodococcus mannitoliphagus]
MRRSLFIFFLASVITCLGCAGPGGEASDAEELSVTCLVKPDAGPCRQNQMGFYFDYRDNRCKSFRYGGCGGRVPFASMRECRDFCGAD